MTLSRILKWSDFLFCLAVKLRSNPSHLVFCSSKVSETRRVLQMSLYPGTLSNFSSRGSEVFPRQKRNVISKGSSGSASFLLDVSCSHPDQKLLSTPSSSPYLPGWAHPPTEETHLHRLNPRPHYFIQNADRLVNQESHSGHSPLLTSESSTILICSVFSSLVYKT